MMTLKFTGRLTKKRNVVVAHCPELDVYSQGYSEEEARKNLREAVRLFLEEAERIGTLEQILEEAGFYRRASYQWQSPSTVFAEDVHLDIPVGV